MCYLGIDTGHFVNRGCARGADVVGLSLISREQNLHLCIKAIGAIATPRPKLVWVSNFADRVYLEEMHRLADAQGVAFEAMVRVSDDTLLVILNRAAIMVYAPWLEPFGLAPLEANTCGAPVVAMAEGGVRETVIDGVTGLLVAHVPEAMPEAATCLLQDPTLARQLGGNARRAVKAKWELFSATDRIERELARYFRPS